MPYVPAFQDALALSGKINFSLGVVIIFGSRKGRGVICGFYFSECTIMKYTKKSVLHAGSQCPNFASVQT